MDEIYVLPPKSAKAVIWWDFYNLEQDPNLWWALKTKDWGMMGKRA